MDENQELSPSQVFEEGQKDFGKLFETQSSFELSAQDKIAHYSIIKELGRGGMGCVYQAYDEKMKQPVALKVILAEEISQKELQRFVIEAKAMAKLNHPNIVRVYDIGSDKNRPYIAMDYVDGVSLKEFLQATTTNTRQLAQLMVKIAGAIAYAHEQEIVHRDLKPANIMVAKNEQPQIMDFGLAKMVKANVNISRKGAIMGTPAYMSPEQASGLKINHKTDLYALGAIFYEMLCSKRLIEGSNAAHIIQNVLFKDPIPLCQQNDKIPLDLEVICHKAVEKKARDRYKDVKAFAKDIVRFLDGEMIEARPLSLKERTWRKIKKNKVVSAIFLVSFLALLIAKVVINFNHQQGLAQEAQKHLQKVTSLEKKISQSNDKLNLYLQINLFLEKAFAIYPSQKTREKYYLLQEKIGLITLNKKNYFLSGVYFKLCKKLGHPKAKELLQKLEQKKNELKNKRINFIHKAMEKAKTISSEKVLDWHAFKIAQMGGKSYILKTLAHYLLLKKKNKWQRILAIRAIGRSGNIRIKKTDSVIFLIRLLGSLHNRKVALINSKEKEEEVEKRLDKEIVEVIWALGRLNDKRAKRPISDIRDQLLSDELKGATRIAFNRISASHAMGNSARDYSIRGRMKFSRKDYQGAIDDYSIAIKKEPNVVRGHFSRGRAYAQLKNFKKAMADYDKALELDPEYTPVFFVRGALYTSRKKYKKAMNDYNRGIALNPKDVDRFYSVRGNLYFALGDYNKAMIDYRSAIAIEPKFSDVYAQMGLIYQQQGKYQKALDHCNKAIKVAPAKKARLYHVRGVVHFKLKNYQKAIADSSQAITINPRSAEAYNNLGEVYRAKKEYAQAIEYHQEAIKIKPKLSLSYNYIGTIYNVQKRYKKALTWYNKAIKANPDKFLAYFHLGNLYFVHKKYKQAVYYYEKTIAKAPKIASAYINLGVIYSSQKKYKQALKIYSKAIAIMPNNAIFYHRKGTCYQQIAMKDFNPFKPSLSQKQQKFIDKALQYLNKATKLNTKFLEAYVSRASIFYMQKHYSKAIADYKKAIAINPNHPIAIKIKPLLANMEKMHQKK